MSQVTINGEKVEFQAGESVIQVAERSGVEIPYYCWHPRLSVAANCRMCLVRVEGAPKLQPACQTACKDGMVVDTESAPVKGAQRAVHEFLLINHPIDCPICDQSGECKLQDYYMKFDLTGSRMAERKVHKPRLEVLGPHVVYNAERCIVCTRCVRFMEEVAGERQLGVFNRGDHAEIGVMPGSELDSPYSLNTVDVCPVGALTSRVFRFKQRAWNLERSDSLCGGCARGCNVHVDQRSEQVYRLLPRENDHVNQAWLCDEGRLTYQRANSERLTRTHLRGEGSERAQPCRPQDARARASELLAPYRGGDRPGVAVALTLHATLEEAYVVGRFAREGLGADGITLLGYADGEADDVLRVADKNPNRAGITAVLQALGLAVRPLDALLGKLGDGSVELLVCVGHEADRLADIAEGLAGRKCISIAAGASPVSAIADVTLPSLSWVQRDGTWVNVDGRAQRLRPAYPPQGDALAPEAWIVDLASRLQVPELSFALPSAQTIRAEMMARLEPFAGAGLNDLGSEGRPLEQGRLS